MDEAHFLTYEANFPGQKQPGLTSQQQQMPADQLLHSWAGIWTLRMRHQDQLLLAGACQAANHSWAGIWTGACQAANHSWAGIWTMRMRHQDQLLLAGACSAANHSWAGIWTLRMLEKINQLLF